MFKYGISANEARTLVTLEGDMDIDVTEVMEEEITPQLLSCERVEIDFAQVPFVDSSGIGLLITLINNMKGQGIGVSIVNLQEEVKQVFSLLQLPEILGYEVCVDFNDIE